MKKATTLIFALMFSSFSQSSGLYFYEFATEDTALAGAGLAARAQDASTVATNPAGMTSLPDHMFTSGLQMMNGNIDYHLNDPNKDSPGNVMNIFPNASGFYSQRINEKLYAGVGLYGNYGLGIDFGNWDGERLIKKSTMVAMTLSPSLGYKLNDRLSIGVSANINYGFLSLTRNVDDIDSKDQDYDWAMGYRAGLLMDLTEQTRVGLTWNSKTEYDFNVNGKIRLPSPANAQYDLPISTQVRAPQQLMVSLVHDVNKQWSVMGNLGWQDWSQFGAPQISVDNRGVDKLNRMKDTWHTAIGVQFRPTEQWRLNAGIGFDSTPYRDQTDVALTLPTGDEWRFGTGAQYQITPTSNIGIAVEYLHMQSSKVQSPEKFQGSYDHPYLWFASVNYSYQF